MMMIRNLSCILMILLVWGSANAQTFDGKAYAKDGDDLVIGGQDIRLFGIDAFKADQMCEAETKLYACGQRAREYLAKKVFGQLVHCEQRDYDAERKRPVAVCWAGREELNAWVVSEGWAVAYRNFSMNYVGEEDQARAQRKGAWRGTYVPAWDWRRGKRLPGEIAAQTQPLVGQGCDPREVV